MVHESSAQCLAYSKYSVRVHFIDSYGALVFSISIAPQTPGLCLHQLIQMGRKERTQRNMGSICRNCEVVE